MLELTNPIKSMCECRERLFFSCPSKIETYSDKRYGRNRATKRVQVKFKITFYPML